MCVHDGCATDEASGFIRDYAYGDFKDNLGEGYDDASMIWRTRGTGTRGKI